MPIQFRRASTVLALASSLALSVLLAAAGPVDGRPKLDPSLRVHPHLQYGAQAEPNKRVRIIVQKTAPSVSSEALARAVNARVLEEFRFITSLILEVPQRAVPQLARQPGVRYISYDGPVQRHGIDASSLETTHLQTLRVPEVWNGNQSATGSSIGIAVLDTGINASHPDFGSGNVTAVTVNSKATNSGDQHGHGTHVAGIIKGKDAQGRYLGVAPDAKLLSVKISDDAGVSTEADLIRGLQWVYENGAGYDIRVVNLSISAGTPSSYVTSPIVAAAEQLWFKGMIVVTAAGNRGAATEAMWFAPSNDPFVITVGALDHHQTTSPGDDKLASYSGRGKSQDGHAKPDIVAPGRKIVAPLASASSTVGKSFLERITNESYIRLTGTSMAAPVVSGAAALLLERNPKLSPDQVKWLLLKTANAYTDQPDSAGVLDIVEAMQVAANGSVGMANQGLTPNSGIDPTTGTVHWDTAYWDSAYWDSAYWDTAYWDSMELD